jgi:protein-tyrosine kinase
MITLSPRSTRTPTRSVLSGPAREKYYALAHWLRSGGNNSGAIARKSLGITSCDRGAGVTTVAMNLAAAAAHSSERPVLLLDLSAVELTRPALDRSSDSRPREIPALPSELSEHVETSSISNLSILRVDRALALALGRERGVENLLRSLENDFDFVVIDLPTAESSVCFACAGLLHGVLLVVEAERTDCEAATRAKQLLDQARANTVGVILNKHS